MRVRARLRKWQGISPEGKRVGGKQAQTEAAEAEAGAQLYGRVRTINRGTGTEDRERVEEGGQWREEGWVKREESGGRGKVSVSAVERGGAPQHG